MRAMIFTNFEDAIGDAASVTLIAVPEPGRVSEDRGDAYEPVTITTGNLERFKQKARAFLRQHDDNVAIYRLRMNKALTATDLESLESMLAENAVGDDALISKAARRQSRPRPLCSFLDWT